MTSEESSGLTSAPLSEGVSAVATGVGARLMSDVNEDMSKVVLPPWAKSVNDKPPVTPDMDWRSPSAEVSLEPKCSDAYGFAWNWELCESRGAETKGSLLSVASMLDDVGV